MRETVDSSPRRTLPFRFSLARASSRGRIPRRRSRAAPPASPPAAAQVLGRARRRDRLVARRAVRRAATTRSSRRGPASPGPPGRAARTCRRPARCRPGSPQIGAGLMTRAPACRGRRAPAPGRGAICRLRGPASPGPRATRRGVPGRPARARGRRNVRLTPPRLRPRAPARRPRRSGCPARTPSGSSRRGRSRVIARTVSSVPRIGAPRGCPRQKLPDEVSWTRSSGLSLASPISSRMTPRSFSTSVGVERRAKTRRRRAGPAPRRTVYPVCGRRSPCTPWS